MQRVTALEIKERERMKAFSLAKSYFKKSGRISSYIADPVIILGSEVDISIKIPLKDPLFLSGEIKTNRYGSFLAFKDDSQLKEIASVLGLEYEESGIQLDLEKTIFPFSFEPFEVRIDSIIIAELNECEYKVIKRKNLSMGRDF